MEQQGLLISAVEIPARKKDGVDKAPGILAQVVYGNALEDGPEVIWLTPPEEHRAVLSMKKYGRVRVIGRLQRGRFYTDAIEPGPAS